MKKMKIQIFKKSFTKVLLLAIILNLTSITASASGFSDVSDTTPNNEAILYLQDHEIVKGYDDGTFKPEKNVNRAELLKIIIEGSKIQLDVTDFTPFSDIDDAEWYAPYVKKAYSSGWINGYNDGTFKPNQTITKVEALKIIGEAQNWQLPTTESTDPWYESYLRYAETNNYLEDQDFSPTNLMTRGSISEIIYRTIPKTKTKTGSKTKIDSKNKTSTDTNTDTKTLKAIIEDKAIDSPDIPTNSTDFSYIQTDFFENITLSEKLPNTFYKNEVYIIEGDVIGENYKTATVIVNDEDKSTHKYFKGTITNKHFKIPIFFRKSGDYSIGLIPGESGKSHASIIHVNTNLPETSANSTAPNNLENVILSYAKDKTSITFNNSENTLKKFTFIQKDKTVTYLSRQNINSIELNYSDFENFSDGEVSYNTSAARLGSQSPLLVTSPFSQSTNKSFNAVEHSFDEINSDEVEVAIPDTLSSTENFSFNGITKTDIKLQALVMTPDGKVDQLDLTTTGEIDTYFNKKIIKKGSPFTFNYTPKTKGRYIIEINNKNSEPSINHPIYVGDIIPIIPDFFDLTQRESYKDNFDLSNERTKLLNLINQSRTSHGLEAIVMDDKLNILAQEHSDDMKTNNYFSHYNLSSKTPEDRRIALGINTSVGENIAKDVSVKFAHFGLMRSASHYENILTADWKKVGLGISLDKGGLIITEEFSINPLTTEDFTKFKTDLLKSINDLRQSKNLNTMIETESLNKSSAQVNNENVNAKTLTAQTLSKALDDNGFNGSAQLIGRVGNPWGYLIKSILADEESLLIQTWQNIGANIQTDKNGKIYTIVIVGKDT